MGREGTRDVNTDAPTGVSRTGTIGDDLAAAGWSFLAAHSGYCPEPHLATTQERQTPALALTTRPPTTGAKSTLTVHRPPFRASRRLAATTAVATAVAVTAAAVSGSAVADTTTPVGGTIVRGSQLTAPTTTSSVTTTSPAAPATSSPVTTSTPATTSPNATPSTTGPTTSSGTTTATTTTTSPAPTTTTTTAAPRILTGPLELTGPTGALRVGAKAIFRGTIANVPYRKVGYPIQLQVLKGSSWATIMQGNTLSTGGFAIVMKTKSAGQGHYRVRTPGAGIVAPRVSASTAVMTGVGSPYSYALMKDRFRFDPCNVIGYRINFDGAPASALADVQGSINRISVATGLRFIYQGSTTAIPFTPGVTYPSDTNLVFAFVTKGTSSSLPAGSRALAVGGPQTAWGPTSVNGNRWSKIATSGILIDRNANLKPGFAHTNVWPYVTLGGVILHEVGHAVGLDHVYSDTLAMMATPPSPHASELSLGDYSGLRLLGTASGCFPS